MSHSICANSGQRDHRTPKYLRKDYTDEDCQGPEIQRRQINEVLDSWMDRIEEDCGLKTIHPDPCEACYPEFTCLGPYPNKRPFCIKKPREPLITNIPIFEKRLVSDKQRVVDQDDRVEIKLVGQSPKDIPVWERPRIRSQKLIAGEYKKLTDCFKRNGLNVADCPRSPSCRVVQNMQEWIELEKNTRRSRQLIECCCCPGMKSSLPQFKCKSCQPPVGKQQQTLHKHGKPVPHRPHHHHQDSPNVHRVNEKGTHYPHGLIQPLSQPQVIACLGMNNPRSSGEMWKDDIDIFGRHKNF